LSRNTAPQTGGSAKVKLTLVVEDQNGKPYEPKSLIVHEYRVLAESGLGKAGYVVSPEAETEVRVVLKGRTPNGVANTESSTARNMAVGAVTLGLGCSEMTHMVDAAGRVAVLRGGREVIDQPLDMKASETSCFSKLNPSWLVQHQEAGVRTYESAVFSTSAHGCRWWGRGCSGGLLRERLCRAKTLVAHRLRTVGAP
jgi:hypothetical protein